LVPPGKMSFYQRFKLNWRVDENTVNGVMLT